VMLLALLTARGVDETDAVRPGRNFARAARVVMILVRVALEARNVRDDVEKLRHRDAVGEARHDRESVRARVALAGHDDRVRVHDRLGEVLGRMVLAHTGQLGARALRVGAGGRERLAVDRVTLVALEADEHLAAALRITTLGP